MKKICGSILLIAFSCAVVFAAEIDIAKFSLAEKMYQNKNYKAALKELKDLILNYPYSAQYQKALYYTAKSHYALQDYDQSARYFSVLEKKSKKETDKRLALFGLGESQFKLKRWKDAAVSFMNFGLLYKNSPAAPAAFYYSGQALEAMNLQADAVSVYRTIVSEYPSSTYYAQALKKIDGIDRSPKRTNTIDISENALNVIDLSDHTPSMTNIVILTNTLFLSNSQNAPQTVQPVPQTILITNITETPDQPEGSNPTIITQTIMMLDTNEMVLQKEYEANKKKEEEIERFRSLIELKAKLLEIKEKALQEKKDAILGNTEDEGSDNE